MCTHVGKVKVSIGEHPSQGEEISRGFLLKKGGTVIAGRQFIIATVGRQCIFMPADGKDMQSVLRIVVSTFLMRGVHTTHRRGVLITPIHVCIFTSVENLNGKFVIDGIGLKSIKTRHAAV